MRIPVFILLLNFLSILMLQGQEVAFTIAEKDLIPEGLAYDPVKRKLYVSSTYKRKILEIDMATGQQSEFIPEGNEGIPGVIGMRVDPERRHLWACAATAGEGMPVRGLETVTDQTGVFQYDLETGKLIRKYTLGKDSTFHFMNDLAIAKDGTVYVTDTGAGKIYRITPSDNMNEFISLQGMHPNGIDLTDKGDLVVAVYGAPHAFLRIDPVTKKHTVIRLPENEKVGGDGLYFYKNSLIAIQPFDRQRIVARYELSSDTTITKVTTFVDPDHSSLFQPTTGVIVGNEFYFIANSQLQHFRKLFRETNGRYPLDQLHDVVILKARLE